MVVYDLAGHHEYFSSHCAFLEAISVSSPAIFLLLQDLTKDFETITREVFYWSTMIDGVCHEKSSVIVVGTHTDMLSSNMVTNKQDRLKSVAMEAIRYQILVDSVTLNPKNAFSKDMDMFMDVFYKTNHTIINNCPSISMMCHMMLAFLKTKLPDQNVDVITLSELHTHLKSDADTNIDPNIPHITALLKTLSEKGLIVFIPCEDPLHSWIVLRKELILKKVNGILFAGPKLKKSIRIASNTGIISTTDLINTFHGDYNSEMIAKFMIHFELCQEVDLSHVITNMAPEGSPSPDHGPLLFFPALVSVDKSSAATVPSDSFRWSIMVKSEQYAFFTTRFLHVLLHRLPYEFALPSKNGKLVTTLPHGCCNLVYNLVR